MSDCSCIHISCDGFGPEFHHSEFRRAIKVHQCNECGSTITIGSSYEYVCGKWNGDLLYYKTCGACHAIREAFFCGSWIYGEILSELYKHIAAHNGEIVGECIASLPPMARDRVCDLIEEYWATVDE